jgi:acetyltransferase
VNSQQRDLLLVSHCHFAPRNGHNKAVDMSKSNQSLPDFFPPKQRNLDALFAPRSVAVIGATETVPSVGRTLVTNLVQYGFPGGVFPVHPRRPAVLGLKAYPNIAAVPARVDLAVIATPAETVPGVIGECVDAGVSGAIIISAGFRECGTAGLALEAAIRSHLRRGGMRVIGPNCLGVMCPRSALNASFAAGMARPGNVAFISQSGALLTAILDWSLQENVGFSAIVSVGSMLDVGWGDLIDYFGDDTQTQSIMLYMESIGDARSFLSSAREVTLHKPIIVIKAGRSDAAAKAAASHTGTLSGSDDVLEAAFRRCGVLRVNRIADLFSMADVLSKQPRPRGPRLTILSNAGGPAVLATDHLIELGGELTQLSRDTLDALNKLLPPHWSHNNPVDILGDASAERFAKAIEIVVKDPNSHGLLVILAPQDITDPSRAAEALVPHAHGAGKPVLASWMGGAGVAAGVSILNRAGIPTFAYPDTAVRSFYNMWRYSYNLRGLYETPLPSSEGAVDRAAGEKTIRAAQDSGRTLLNEVESKQLLSAYGMPTVPTLTANSEDEAAQLAEQVGYPVVLKLLSATITHKTDVGGVQLNLPGADSVRRAYRHIQSEVQELAGPGHFDGVTVQPMVRFEGYEVILGSSVDPQFGPVLLFGTGGQLVEVFKDRALALPPLNSTLALRLMEQTRIFTAFKGVRGRKPIDLAALEQVLVKFSRIVVEQPRIKEIDINPLLVSADQILALDARVVLHGPDVAAAGLSRPAIRPYPVQYVSPWQLKNGVEVTLRPIRPDDEPLLAKFHETLSDYSVYLRYLHAMKLSQRVAHERLARLCFIDYAREMAIVAERCQARSNERAIIAVARLMKLRQSNDAEFAIVISDAYHRAGLGAELLRRLLQVGRDENIRRILGHIHPENTGMQKVCEKLGFTLRHSPSEGAVTAEITL